MKGNQYFLILKCELNSIFKRKKVITELERSKDSEIGKIADYIKTQKKIPMMPYTFCKNYKFRKIKVYRDREKKLFYVEDNGKKLYFQRRFFFKAHARNYYKNLCIEQDGRSPHCYTSGDFDVEKGSVLLDIGAAEGIFLLRNIDKVSEAYLFECDDRWIEALRYTFSDYRDKVHILKKYVGSQDNGENITLDNFKEISDVEQKDLFVKLDIEGAEVEALENSMEFLASARSSKLAVCCYHCADHEKKIRKMFSGHKVSNTDGYMFFYYDKNFDAPYIRRGVLRIEY